jgi:hypothetical protein
MPVLVTQLPADLREAASIVEWPTIRFDESMALRPEELCPCELSPHDSSRAAADSANP